MNEFHLKWSHRLDCRLNSFKAFSRHSLWHCLVQSARLRFCCCSVARSESRRCYYCPFSLLCLPCVSRHFPGYVPPDLCRDVPGVQTAAHLWALHHHPAAEHAEPGAGVHEPRHSRPAQKSQGNWPLHFWLVDFSKKKKNYITSNIFLFVSQEFHYPYELMKINEKKRLKKEMAIHSSTLARKIPWTEEPGRLQSMGSRRVAHDWVTSVSLFHWWKLVWKFGYMSKSALTTRLQIILEHSVFEQCFSKEIVANMEFSQANGGPC